MTSPPPPAPPPATARPVPAPPPASAPPATTEPWALDWSGLADASRLCAIPPTIPGLLRHAASRHPERAVLVLDERVTTYGDLAEKSAALARRLLAHGVGKDARVGVMVPNDETFLITWFAIARIGAIAVTLPSLATPSEIARIARHADLQMLVAPARYLHHDYTERLAQAFGGIAAQRAPYRIEGTPRLRDVWLWCDAAGDCPAWATPVGLEPPHDVDTAMLTEIEDRLHPGDPAGIIYTSGSTAEPKGVIHSHGSFVRQGQKLAASFDYEPGERVYASMPFFWVGGLTTTAMAVIAAGGTMLASHRKAAELLDFIEAQRTTAIVTWPHILRSLAAEPSFASRDWTAMRNGLFYEALPAERRPADLALLATPIGMTETNGPYTVVDRFLTEDQRGSLGKLMPGVQARLMDPDDGTVLAEWAEGDREADSSGAVGVLQLRSDVMMLGMVKRERGEVFTPDGWYHTYDMVEFRAGHLHYHGRADDLIKAHGANVSPREVETVIAKLAGVAAVHAVGVSDMARGTVVGAVVVPEPGAVLDVAAIRQAATAALASYKVPRVIAVRSAAELPMLASSKVDRRALAAMLQQVKDEA
jgi:acyl-CoA synthetase (AMP-forming)/AMP-acid ligase II